MKTRYRFGIATLLVFFAVSAISVSSQAGLGLGQGFYVRSGRTRCCLPKYAYGDDDKRIVTVVDSEKFVPLQKAALSHGLIRRSVRVRSSITANGATREVIEDSTANVANPIATAAKQFVISPAVAGPISMTLPGAIVYDSGEFRFTCTLSHSGGRYKNLGGNRCTIRVQGLRASKSVGGVTDPRDTLTAPVLFELTESIRVSSSRPTILQISDKELGKSVKYFAEISHIRVYLECRLDR